MPNFEVEKNRTADLATSGSPEKSIQSSPVQLSKTGPWGQLEYFEALLDAPADLVKESQPKSIRTRWFFRKMQPDDVSEFLGSLGLPGELEKELNDRDRWITESSGVTVFPTTSHVLALPEKSRILLHRMLSKWPENPYHAEPEIVYGKSVRKWFEGFEISEEVLQFIETTSYPTLSSRLFADTPGVLSIAKSENERVQILRAFSRTPTLVAKLCLESGTAEELASYWNRGIRFKDTSTFLASLKRYDAVHKIDLVHLLPAGVRKILYTFPSPSHTRSGYLPDCHWSSLNFFNPEPLERLSDPPQATAYTLENFTQVAPPYELGDVLFFTDTQTGDAYHSCAFIADDIVFTKNGRSPLQPWVLMKLDQVKDLYDLHFRTNTTAYRRKS
ncbi:MAG: hypothetical protein DVB28_000627 [Verrucomicrobia bacterium]|nr:MAG: hypothetical protein DVB28_000627 [Verrucomicrobiota bacterium]